MTGSEGWVAEWAPERLIDADLAAWVVAEQFPELAGLPVRPFAAGSDNVVYAVGDTWLFRFVHRAIALDGSRRELAVLRHLADCLPLPVPLPVFVGRPTPEVDWPFWGARRIPGEELAERALPDAARVPVAREVGAFLRALHAPALAVTAAAAAEAAGAPLLIDPMRRGNPAVVAARARPRLGRLRQAGIDLPFDVIDELLASGESVATSQDPAVLVHGDLHIRHVLVSTAGETTGVVDWGDTALGDPAVDLMLAYAAFSGEAREALFGAYRSVSSATELRARALAVHVSSALLEYALSDGRAALATEARAAVHRATI